MIVDFLNETSDLSNVEQDVVSKYFKTALCLIFPQFKFLANALSLLGLLNKAVVKPFLSTAGLKEDELTVTEAIDKGFDYLSKIEKSELCMKWIEKNILKEEEKEKSKDTKEKKTSEETSSKKSEKEEKTPKKTTRTKKTAKTNANDLVKDQAKVIQDAKEKQNYIINQNISVVINNMATPNGIMIDYASIIEACKLNTNDVQKIEKKLLEGLDVMSIIDTNKAREALGLEPIDQTEVEIKDGEITKIMGSNSEATVKNTYHKNTLVKSTTKIEKESSTGIIETTFDEKKPSAKKTKKKTITSKDTTSKVEYECSDGKEKISKYVETSKDLERTYDYSNNTRKDMDLKTGDWILMNQKGNEILSTSDSLVVCDTKEKALALTDNGKKPKAIVGKKAVLGCKQEYTTSTNESYTPVIGTILDSEATQDGVNALVKVDETKYVYNDLGSKSDLDTVLTRDNQTEANTLQESKIMDQEQKNSIENKTELVAE